MAKFHCLGLLFMLSIIFTPVHSNETTAIVASVKWHRSAVARNLTEAIVKIVEHYFVGKYRRRSFNFQVKTKNEKNLYFFHEVIAGTVELLDARIGITLGSGIFIPVGYEMHFSILLVDSTESLEYLYTNILKYHIHIEGTYFIVLHTLPTVNHYYDELYSTLELNWRAGISHANVLVYATHTSILLYNDVPYTPFHCQANVPVVYNQFTNGQWLHTEFYVSKASNLHGCPLVCATWEDLPYFRKSSRSTKEKPVFDGLEGKLLEYLSQRMNFSVDLHWMNDKEINRTIYDESGIFDELFTSGVDFVVGAFHYKPTSLQDSYTPTTVYYLSTFCFVVSSETDPFDPFEKLLLPFDGEIWLVLSLIFVGGNAILYFVTQWDRQIKYLLLGRKQQRPVYNMFVISLGGAVTKDPRVPFSRFLLMVWLLASFVLRTVYQGLLYYFIKSDLNKDPPKTIDELKADYTLLMTEVVYNDMENLEWLQKRAVILNGTEVESFDMLTHSEDYGLGKMAILTSHEYFGYYKMYHAKSFQFYLVPQVLFTQQLSIFMKKNSIFLDRFNMYIKSFINHGLMNHWDHFLVSGQSYKKSTDDRPKPMNLTQLHGALHLLAICLCTCVCVFVVELGVRSLTVCYRLVRKWFRKLFKKNRRRTFLP